MVMIELAPAATELGLNEAFAPRGARSHRSATVCPEPLVTAVLMVVVPLWLWSIVRLFGLELSEKSLPACTRDSSTWYRSWMFPFP